MLYGNVWAAARGSRAAKMLSPCWVWEKKRFGAGSMPLTGRYYSKSLSVLALLHLILPLPSSPRPPRLMIQQAEEAKVFFLAVFSLPMLLPTSSRNKEGPRRGGGGRRNERLVVLCKGRDEEINNSHYSQEGVKGKQSQSGQAVFSWLQQTLPGVIY